MECSNILLLLPEYIENRLNSDENKLVAGHLDRCESCLYELNEIKSLFSVTEPAEFQKENVPAGYFDELWPDLYKRIQKEGLNQAGHESNWFMRFFKSSYKTRFYQLASVPVVVLLAVMMYFSLEKDKTSPYGYSLAQRFSTAFSEKLTDSYAASAEKNASLLSVLFSTDKDSTASDISIDFADVFSYEKQDKAYDKFTDLVADIVVQIR